jgi:hypothetical protein
MSRSALWRQEGNLKERERNADELFLSAVEEGRVSCPTCLSTETCSSGPGSAGVRCRISLR